VTDSTDSDGSIDDLNPELSSDVLGPPCRKLVPVVQAVTILEYRLDGKHSQEALSIPVPVVYRHV
jgi:hypothetical protein